MSIVQRLTENIVSRDLQKEGQALQSKWEKTGLLEGITSDRAKSNLAMLLENQAKELLRESSSMSAGDVEGFAAVAFPLVRRVFGNLIANDLVSVQPMSLPSGLIFFLDFSYTDTRYNGGAIAGESIYGGGRLGQQITAGLDLTSVNSANGIWNAEKGMYNLNNSYSSPTGTLTLTTPLVFAAIRSGSTNTWPTTYPFNGNNTTTPVLYQALGESLILDDPDLSGSNIGVFSTPISVFTSVGLNVDNLITIAMHTPLTGAQSGYHLVRRLTRKDPVSSSNILLTFASWNSGSFDNVSPSGIQNLTGALLSFDYSRVDAFGAGTGLGSVAGTSPWGLEFEGAATGLNTDIPEIDIKVDSVAVTAVTKKLKAKWTPELGQDLNAYHNLDAEVELTSILSEQIGLEIDQEILNDLIRGATGAIYHWSRSPGQFLNRTDGTDLSNGTSPPDFTGNISMWYESLLEVVNDVSAQIHRKTLRGGANFLVCSPEVASILEMTAGFRANVTVDDEKGTAGAVNVGSISKKWDIFVDPYFPRNIILVGRKGSSFLESGYVYAPYVPLQVTPTIFGVEDFTPRKGVMTRYAKKMIKPDHYGLVVVHKLMG
ncbi:MAG: hypothetical protein Q8P81_04360 [Nanoarchaeota archaeon]|nr:hypothetical protein [Nanoarchaeota archaeon]